MSLNYYLARHQISLIRARAAPSVEVRGVHQAFASAYADRIEEMGIGCGALTKPLVKS